MTDSFPKHHKSVIGEFCNRGAEQDFNKRVWGSVSLASCKRKEQRFVFFNFLFLLNAIFILLLSPKLPYLGERLTVIKRIDSLKHGRTVELDQILR